MAASCRSCCGSCSRPDRVFTGLLHALAGARAGGPGRRSPAHCRGRPPRPAHLTASTPPSACQRQGNREWGLRPPAQPPVPTTAAARRRHATASSGGGGGACGRRPHSRSPWRLQAGAGVDEASVAALGGRPRQWAGERRYHRRPKRSERCRWNRHHYAEPRYQLASRSGVAPMRWIDRSAPSYSSSGVSLNEVTARIAP